MQIGQFHFAFEVTRQDSGGPKSCSKSYSEQSQWKDYISGSNPFQVKVCRAPEIIFLQEIRIRGIGDHYGSKRAYEGAEKDAEGNIIYEQVKTTNCPSNLKKKFKEWRIQVPRSLYGKY